MGVDHGLELGSRLTSVQLAFIEHLLYAQPWGRAVLRAVPCLYRLIAEWGAESEIHGPNRVNYKCHG